MNLVQWSPFRDMSLLQNQMNRIFQETMQGWPASTDGGGTWMPAADIFETENDLLVKVDLPGVDPKQTDVRVENNVLTIRGERQLEEETNKENFHRVERTYGTFSRSFTLPASVNADKIQANYKNGVLSITLPKAEQARPRRIQIAA
jgi:HSP20 family protein